MKKDIDSILLNISKQSEYSVQSAYNFPNHDEFLIYKKNIILLKDENLIEHKKTNPNFYEITSLGLKVLNEGGWENYQLKYKLKEDRKNKKEELDLKISEFQLKTKWLPYWISAISLLISLLALYKSFNSSNAKTEKINSEYKVENRQVEQQNLAN